MRPIDADALIDVIERYANEPVKLNDRRWDTRCTAIIADMIGTVKTQSTVAAIPVEWLRDKMMERQMLMTKNPYGYVLAEWLEQEAR